MPPEEVAELTASVWPGDYIDIGRREIAAFVPALARGRCGIIRGDKLEVSYRSRFGDLTLARLPAPEYAPVWGRSGFGTFALAMPSLPVRRRDRSLESAPRTVRLAPRSR
jgi:hypothetical protein